MPSFAPPSGFPGAWYWAVADDDTRVWSSAKAAYVPSTDADYAAWQGGGNMPSRIISEAELRVALAANGIVMPGAPRTATTYQLMSVFTDAQRTTYASVKAWDQRLFTARDMPWPEDNIKIGRIATALGTTPAAWFDAALAPST